MFEKYLAFRSSRRVKELAIAVFDASHKKTFGISFDADSGRYHVGCNGRCNLKVGKVVNRR